MRGPSAITMQAFLVEVTISIGQWISSHIIRSTSSTDGRTAPSYYRSRP